jgi:hypothetical protein
MIFVAYYTPDYIGDLNKYFIPSAKLLNINYKAIEVPDRGNWSFNTYYTPEILLQELDKNPGETIIKVGADAVFKEYPEELEKIDKEVFDIAVNYIPQDSVYHPDCSVVMAHNNDNARFFLKEWDKACKDKLHSVLSSVWSDEDVLDSIIMPLYEKVKIKRLHHKYGQSYHFNKGEFGNPIIEEQRTSWNHNRNRV